MPQSLLAHSALSEQLAPKASLGWQVPAVVQTAVPPRQSVLQRFDWHSAFSKQAAPSMAAWQVPPMQAVFEVASGVRLLQQGSVPAPQAEPASKQSRFIWLS